ncbi:GAF domain-containing protein [Chloroflexota bacterium]
MLESPVGIVLLFLGAGFIALLFGLLRVVPRLQSLIKSPKKTPPSLDIPSHDEAVLLIQSGGRVNYINDQARELFNIWGEEPNLESLARRARPSETFLALCAGAGQARFRLGGRFIEGTSYYASDAAANGAKQKELILVTLRRPQIVIEGGSPLAAGAETAGSTTAGLTTDGSPSPDQPAMEVSSQAFTIFSELSQAMATSLELNPTLQTILESVERLIPSDIMEITVWDEEQEHLIPYRFIGLAGVDRHIERAEDRYEGSDGYSGHLISKHEHLLIKDVDQFRMVRPAVDRQQFPFQSYLGVPLLLAGQLVGTLELASLSKDAYDENDLDVLKLLSGQAAVALNNALLYKQEQERVVELAGLAELAQSTNAIRDVRDLFTRLTESISSLVDVEILGFLVYEENRAILEGRTPFIGIPSNAIEWYQTTIKPGSLAEDIWNNADPVIATDAPEDERLEAFELHHLALVAGIRHMVLVPLTSGGRMFGYLLVGNKRDNTPFDQSDVRLLTIIAGQAAPIIENASLVQLSRQRAQRAETLRRIASLTSSTATLDEILKFSILDLARLLNTDTAVLFLLDESRGELRVHKESLFGVTPEIADSLARIPIDDPQYQLTVTGSKRQFSTNDFEEDEEIWPLYQLLVEQLELRSAIALPFISRERGIGELMLGSFRVNFFSPGDSQTVATASGQLAAAIEQSTLYSQTDHSLRLRVEQLTALTRISRELNTTLQLEHLIRRVYDEALRTTRANCGTIMLFELSEVSNALKIEPAEAGSGYQGRKISYSLGDKPAEAPHPLEKMVLEKGEAIVISDFQAAQAAGEPAMPPAHENVRSALAVPIAYQGQIAGLIHLHARQPDHFGPTEKEIVESLAIQAAIAIGNAHRYREQVQRSELLNRRVETLSKLFDVSNFIQAEQPLEESLEAIAYAIQESTPFEMVLVSVYDSESNSLIRTAGAGIPLPTFNEMKDQPQPWEPVTELLQPEFCLGRAYFLPHERLPILPSELHTVNIIDQDAPPSEKDQWHQDDLLFVPLFDADNQPLGVISVDAPRNNLRPDRPSIETVEIFSSQAALIIESQRNLRQLRKQYDEVSGQLDQAKETAERAQKHLPDMLHKDIEQTLALRQLGQQSNRINAGLDIAAIVSHQTNRSNVLKTLGEETLVRMEFDTVLIAEYVGDRLQLSNIIGAIPAGVNPTALLGQRNPLRHSLQNGEALLVPDLQKEAEWHNTPLLRALEAESFVSLPVSDISAEQLAPGSKQNESIACMLAISRASQMSFTAEDQQLYSMLSRQVAVALQNLRLLEETTHRLQELNLLLDFGRQLGSLDPQSILHTLVESALNVVPAAQAAMVAIWDGKQGLLIPQAASGYADNAGLLEVLYQPGEGLPGQVFESKEALRLDEVDFARHYNLSPENLMRYRNATRGRLPVSSMAVPIMTGTIMQSASPEGASAQTGDARSLPLGVLILDNAQITATFTADDLAVITSLVQQTALTLENARLYQSSEQRSQQLEALTNVSTTVTASLEPGELIDTLLDQLQEILPYDTGILWLREDLITASGASRKDRMVVQAAHGFEDSDQRIGLTIDIQDSQLLNEMTKTGQPIWVADVREDARFRTFSFDFDDLAEDSSLNNLIGFEYLSWLGVPLIASGEVIGVIALEKKEARFYSSDDIQVVTAFTVQAAIGLVNAQLYQESVTRAQELDQQSQTMSILNLLSKELSSSLEKNQILDSAAQQFFQILPCSLVSAFWVDYPNSDQEEPSDLRQAEIILQTQYPDQNGDAANMTAASITNIPLFGRLSETAGVFNSEDISQEPDLEPLMDFLTQYNTHSILITPIVSGQASEDELTIKNHLHGLLMAHNDQAYHYNAEELELARTISNQIAIAMQNARLFDETRSLTEDLEIRVQQRTSELEHEHQRAETLLQIITELSASLDLDQVLNSTLRVLSEFVNANQITILIARPGEKKLHRLASIGYTSAPDKDGSPTPLDIDQGLAGWIISQRQSVLIDNVREDKRWVDLYNNGEDTALHKHTSAIGVPLMSGADALGSLLLFHQEANHFSHDQLDLVQAAANQVGSAVNNAELYRLIRDQAEDLGSMLRSQQIETSRSKAILEAVADGVLVTDEMRHITLFNESAENILGLSRDQILGKSMEHFSGLFGRAARRWMETIHTWSQDPENFPSGETFAEQITLEDARVISVHLAPVSLHNDFLGTVSIFQDITHQVEVDRLKSEFVATVSHELRTPMTSIKGYVEVLLMGAAGQLTEQQTGFLQVVKTNTERLAVLVNDLLDISQIEAGRAALSLQPLNLDEVSNQAITDIQRRSEEDDKPVEIIKNIPADLPRVLGDPQRVQQIFDNLLDNAYQYNTPNGKIIISMQVVENEVQIDVKDTGVGIHPGDHERVFERFFRGENPLVLGVSGTGLGLSIVKNLVKMHNGRIWFKSTGIQGQGSTFSITLPVYTQNEGADQG